MVTLLLRDCDVKVSHSRSGISSLAVWELKVATLAADRVASMASLIHNKLAAENQVFGEWGNWEQGLWSAIYLVKRLYS